MSAERRFMLIAGVALAALTLVVMWSLDGMVEQRAIAATRARDLAECRIIGKAIEALRQGPTVAAAEEMGIQRLGRHIEAASQQAKFSGSELEGVFPQTARRIGDTPYQLKPTSLTLRGVTLQQLATFLYHLTDDSGLNVRSLRLRTPLGESVGRTWDAETTLTYLIYSPPESGRD